MKRPKSAGCQHKMGDELKINNIAEKNSPKINTIKEINIKFKSKKLNIPHAQLNNAEEIRSYAPKPFWLKDYSKKQGLQILSSNMEYNASSFIRNDLNKQAAKEKNERIIEESTNIKAEIYSLEKRINSKLDEKFGEMYNVMASGFDWIINYFLCQDKSQKDSYLNRSIPLRNKSFSIFKEIKIEKDEDDKKISNSGNEPSGDVSSNSNEQVEDKKKSDSGNEHSGNVSSNSNEQVEQSNLINDSHKFYSKHN
jgi:hypothetical protein